MCSGGVCYHRGAGRIGVHLAERVAQGHCRHPRHPGQVSVLCQQSDTGDSPPAALPGHVRAALQRLWPYASYCLCGDRGAMLAAGTPGCMYPQACLYSGGTGFDTATSASEQGWQERQVGAGHTQTKCSMGCWPQHTMAEGCGLACCCWCLLACRGKDASKHYFGISFNWNKVCGCVEPNESDPLLYNATYTERWAAGAGTAGAAAWSSLCRDTRAACNATGNCNDLNPQDAASICSINTPIAKTGWGKELGLGGHQIHSPPVIWPYGCCCCCCRYERFVASGGLDNIDLDGVKTLLSEIGEQWPQQTAPLLQQVSPAMRPLPYDCLAAGGFTPFAEAQLLPIVSLHCMLTCVGVICRPICWDGSRPGWGG